MPTTIKIGTFVSMQTAETGKIAKTTVFRSIMRNAGESRKKDFWLDNLSKWFGATSTELQHCE